MLFGFISHSELLELSIEGHTQYLHGLWYWPRRDVNVFCHIKVLNNSLTPIYFGVGFENKLNDRMLLRWGSKHPDIADREIILIEEGLSGYRYT